MTALDSSLMRDGRALTNAILVDSAWKQLVEGLEHVAIVLDESRPIGDVFGRRETVESLVAGRRSCQILSSFPQKAITWAYSEGEN